MSDDSSICDDQKVKWETSYPEMTQEAAEKRLGFSFEALAYEAIPVDSMLVEAKCETEDIGEDAVKRTKETVYARIAEYLQFEGYPTDARPDFNENNVSDLVAYIIGPILFDFENETGRPLQLRRGGVIVSKDSETGGHGEFVVVERNPCFIFPPLSFVLIIQSSPSSPGEAIKHCSLAMKDMWDSNGRGEVYGFITTGEDWRMVRYDGIAFQMTERFTVLFGAMCKQKDRWMKEHSVLVDCINVASRRGGIVEKDVA